MTPSNLKLGLGVLVTAGAIAALVIQHRAEEKLQVENDSLRQKIAQLQTQNLNLSRREAAARLMLRLPAPHVEATMPTAEPLTQDLPSTNLYARFKDRAPILTSAQVEAYLKANGTNAASLLAAYRTSGDAALLEEAMQEFPNNPQVAFESLFQNGITPEEQRQRLDAFEKSAPDNALANYLSALNYFQAGQADQAVQELNAVSGKPFNDYTRERYQDDAEAYEAAGYSQADAEAIASMQELLPQLKPLKQLGREIVDLANAYSQTSDPTSAQAVLQIGTNLGQSYADFPAGEPLISQLVGISIERLALDAMNPNSPYENTGQTVQEMLNQLAQQTAVLRQRAQQFTPLQSMMSDQDWINYTERRMLFGESAAEQWVINKYGEH